LGWLAGAAYQIPEIALKASATYRSKIKHQLKRLNILMSYKI
jgi:long-chain fatty acid transport protein